MVEDSPRVRTWGQAAFTMYVSAEAQHLQVRSRLMIELTRLIQDQRLTQAKAAEIFGVTQPRISDLTRGKIDRFSIDK